MPRRPSADTPGILCALTAALAFSTIGLWGKLAQGAQLPTYTLLTWRFGLAALLLLTLGAAGERHLTGRRRLTLLAGGALYTLATAGYFATLARLSAGTASLLLYLAPAFVVLSAWTRGRRPAAPPLGAVALTLAGLALVVGLPGGADRDPAGLALGVLTAALYAAYLPVSERWLAGTRPLTATAYMALVSALGFGLLGAGSGTLRVPAGALEWGLVAAILIIPTLVAVPALYAAIARVGAARTGCWPAPNRSGRCCWRSRFCASRWGRACWSAAP